MHNIHGQMAYSFEQKMWHALGKVSTVPQGAVEALSAEPFNGGFNVRLMKAGWLDDNDNWIPSEGSFAIMRTPTPYDNRWVKFDECSDRYHPLQPMEVAEMFDKMVKVPVETMAFLGAGEECFLSWEMPNVSIRQNDELNMYGIIKGGFDTKHGWRLFTAVHRPVCQNTVNLAQGWADNNSGGNALTGNQWRGKGTNPDLLEHLGYWMQFLQDRALREAELIQATFKSMTEFSITSDSEVMDILYEAFPNKSVNTDNIPPELVAKAMMDNDTFNRAQGKIRDTIMATFQGGTAITPDFWGVTNATSEAVCHFLPSKKPIANSVMFGDRSSITNRVISVLMSRMSGE